MEVTRILDIVKTKKAMIWFIILIFILLGYLYSYHYIEPEYQATSTLLLIPNSSSTLGNQVMMNSDLTINAGLIETYRRIGENARVLNQVIQNLGLDMTEEQLLKHMKISVKNDTYVIQVAVTDTNPQRARDIVKEFNEVFLKEIKEIYQLNNIGIVDQAQLPQTPYNINHGKDMVLFFVMGIGASFVCILLIYLFDNTIKKEEEIEKYIELTSLGNIPVHENKKQEIVDRKDAKSYVTESINTIRTNILYRNSVKNAKTILITSCTPQEGKSWVSANMAVAFAEIDKKVLLMDADLRKGRAHKIFQVENRGGLSNYLCEMTESKKQNLEIGKKYIRQTQIPNLHIMPNGMLPPNPSELLESDQMKELLALLKKAYDVIIIDAPPCKLVTDSMILATIVDSTILVANSEKTKIRELNEIKKAIQMVGGEIIGTILNKRRVKKKNYDKNYYEGQVDIKEEKLKMKQMVSVEELLQQAMVKIEDLPEKPEETVETKKEENQSYEDLKKWLEEKWQQIEGEKQTQEKLNQISEQYKEILWQVKDTSYVDKIIEEVEKEKLTKQEIEEMIKQQIMEFNNTQQFLKINEMLKDLRDGYGQLINKVDTGYTDLADKIENHHIELSEKIENNYTELSTKIETNDKLEIRQEESTEVKSGKNIIDFRAFKRQNSKKKNVFLIEEDISYEDLEQTATCVVSLQPKKKMAGSL